MSRQNTDLNYIEIGYFTPEEYYVYTANAGSALNVTGNLTCDASLAGQLEEANGILNSTATIIIAANRLAPTTAAVTVTATTTATVTKILNAGAVFTATFTPVLTATAFKNHTAVLDSTSTMSTDAVANKSANVLLEHIADLNAMAAKEVTAQSSMAITASLSSTPSKNVLTSSALSTTASFAVTPQYVQLASAALATRATLFASRNIGANAPVTITGTFTGTSAQNSHTTSRDLSDIPQSTNWWYQTSIQLDPRNTWSSTADAATMFRLTLGTRGSGLPVTLTASLRYRATEGATITVFLNFSGTNNFVSGDFNTGVFGSNTFAPTFTIGVSVTGENRALYVNNTRIAFKNGGINTSGWTAPGLSGVQLAPSFAFTNQSMVIDAFTDYAWLALGNYSNNGAATLPTASQTTPSGWTEDTLFLYYFNGNGDEAPRTLTQTGQAAFASTAQINAQPQPLIKLATANISATAQLTATAGETQSASADLSTAFTQTTTATRFARFESLQSATVTQTALVGNRKQFTSVNFVAFTSSMDIDARLAGVALLETRATMAVSAVKTSRAASVQTFRATQTSAATVTAGANLILTATVTQTATVIRRQQAAAALNTSASLTAEIDAINRVQAALSATFAQTVTVLRRRPASAAFTVTANQNAVIEFTHNSTASFQSTITQTAVNDRIRTTTSDQTSQFGYQLEDTLFKGLSVAIAVTATQATTANYTADAAIDQDAIAIQLTAAVKNAVSGIDLDSTATMSVTASRLRDSEYGSLASTGVNNQVRVVPFRQPPTTGPQIRRGFIISLWARRVANQSQQILLGEIPLISSINQHIEMRDGFISDRYGARTYSRSIAILYYWDPDEGFPVWNNVVPTDGDWHHYAFELTDITPGLRWRLWVDGVDQGLAQAINSNGVFYNQNNLRVGSANIDTAQIWMGSESGSYDPDVAKVREFNIDDFYQGGFVDLGPAGLGEDRQLPAPFVYNVLSDPWTGVEGPQAAADIPLYYDGLYSKFTLVGESVSVLVLAASITVQSQLTVTANFTVDNTATVQSEFALDSTARTQIGIISDLTVIAAQSTVINKRAGADCDLISTATVTATPGDFELATATLSVTALLEVAFDSVPPQRAEAELASQFTLTADSTSFSDSTVLIATLGTLTADVTVIPPVRITADLVTTATMSVTIGSIEQFAVLTATLGSMTTQANITASAQSTQTAQAQAQINAVKFTGVICNLQALNFQITAGDIINLDPALTYVIGAETREFQILREQREFKITEETRELIILKG